MRDKQSALGLAAYGAFLLAAEGDFWPQDSFRLVRADEPRKRMQKPKAVQKRRAKNRAARKARKANR